MKEITPIPDAKRVSSAAGLRARRSHLSESGALSGEKLTILAPPNLKTE